MAWIILRNGNPTINRGYTFLGLRISEINSDGDLHICDIPGDLEYNEKYK